MNKKSLPVIYIEMVSRHSAGGRIEIRGEGKELIDDALDYLDDRPSDAKVAVLEGLAKAGYIKLVKDAGSLKVWPN